MRTNSGASSFPLATASSTATANTESTPPKSDSNASFHDVLQQEGGDSSSPRSSDGQATTPANANASASAAPVTTTTAGADGATQADEVLPSFITSPSSGIAAKTAAKPTANGPSPTQNNLAAFVPSTGLSAMIVQAAAQTAQSKQLPATKMVAQEAASSSSPAEPVLGSLDLAALIAQATRIVSNPAATPTKSSNGSGSTSGANSGSDSGAAPASQAALSISSPPDLSTLIAQAAILNSNSASLLATSSNGGAASFTTISALNMTPGAITATSLMLGKELPELGSKQGSMTAGTKEKKSSTVGTEGTFLQPGTDGTTTTSSAFNLLATTFAGTNQWTAGQGLTNTTSSKTLSLEGISGAASGTGGTANVEKDAAMNATSNFPEIFAGTNSVPQQTPVDMQIKLSSNHDFEDALKQVMHVAQLTETSPTSRAPMRVEMEIQTPPGAIVNVYVSKQNDQWRAQLSTNDPQALAWVQDKMSSLRQSSDLGVEVRWLPPQMESTASVSSSHESGLGWDRGGQQQPNQQQQNEQQQSGRQKRAELYAGIGVGQFMDALTAVGSAA